MSNLSQGTQIKHVGSYLAGLQVPILAAAVIFQGAMVCLTAAGYAVRAGTAGTGCVQGVAAAGAPTPTSSGDYNVNLLTGIFARPLHGSHVPTIADVGKFVYASDDFTLSNDPTDGPIAGVLTGFEAGSGLGLVFIHPSNAVVNTAAEMDIPLNAILAAGTPMAAWADDAGASSPGVTLANSEAMGLRWNNFATQIAVWMRFSLPADLDVTSTASLVVKASKTGATLADATTFDITIFNNATGALHDADATYGGATSAMTGDATAKTVQSVSRTLAAADLGVAGDPVSFSIKPTNGTLGTDDLIIHAIKLVYKRKQRSA